VPFIVQLNAAEEGWRYEVRYHGPDGLINRELTELERADLQGALDDAGQGPE
jgi:hypothetical protein